MEDWNNALKYAKLAIGTGKLSQGDTYLNMYQDLSRIPSGSGAKPAVLPTRVPKGHGAGRSCSGMPSAASAARFQPLLVRS